MWLVLHVGLAWSNDSVQSYRLGRGYALGDSGFRLGGYANAEIMAAGQLPWQFQVNDLSLFVSWDNGSRIRFFSELELADVLTAGEKQPWGAAQTHFESERFYFDGLVNDKLTVRIGKFLTPVGQWNVLHAAPLV